METPHEERKIRCPKLGGPVTFSYCRVESIGEPCPRLIQCWREIFDVESYLRSILGENGMARSVQEAPKPKLATLVELIEQAKSRMREREARENEQS
jgi:hypothetical protein